MDIFFYSKLLSRFSNISFNTWFIIRKKICSPDSINLVKFSQKQISLCNVQLCILQLCFTDELCISHGMQKLNFIRQIIVNQSYFFNFSCTQSLIHKIIEVSLDVSLRDIREILELLAECLLDNYVAFTYNGQLRQMLFFILFLVFEEFL